MRLEGRTVPRFIGLERSKMGDFTFSFDVDGDGNDVGSTSRDSHTVKGKAQDGVTLRQAKEINIPEYPLRNKDARVLSLPCDDVNLSYLHPQDVEGMVEEQSDIKEAISTHSDLLPCVYEGGLKVWECSLDLVQYLQEQDPVLFCGQTILELGCGAGLPGIYALKKGATIHFQDYNEEVLKLLTIPNVQLNSTPDVCHEKCRFLAGDWSLVQDLLMQENISYDVILTSETIYSLDSQPRLYNIIRGLLKPDGKVYLAAKTHYFGVGGGTRQFEDFVRDKGEFEIQSLKVISQGVQREILQMQPIRAGKKGEKT